MIVNVVPGQRERANESRGDELFGENEYGIGRMVLRAQLLSRHTGVGIYVLSERVSLSTPGEFV